MQWSGAGVEPQHRATNAGHGGLGRAPGAAASVLLPRRRTGAGRRTIAASEPLHTITAELAGLCAGRRGAAPAVAGAGATPIRLTGAPGAASSVTAASLAWVVEANGSRWSAPCAGPVGRAAVPMPSWPCGHRRSPTGCCPRRWRSTSCPGRTPASRCCQPEERRAPVSRRPRARRRCTAARRRPHPRPAVAVREDDQRLPVVGGTAALEHLDDGRRECDELRDRGVGGGAVAELAEVRRGPSRSTGRRPSAHPRNRSEDSTAVTVPPGRPRTAAGVGAAPSVPVPSLAVLVLAAGVGDAAGDIGGVLTGTGGEGHAAEGQFGRCGARGCRCRDTDQSRRCPPSPRRGRSTSMAMAVS